MWRSTRRGALAMFMLAALLGGCSSGSSSGGTGGPGGGSGGSGGGSGGSGGGSGGSGGGSGGSGGGTGGTGGTGGVGTANCGTSPVCTSNGNLGAWNGTDNVAPSSCPPCGLGPTHAPMFIGLGFDDCIYGSGIDWLVQTAAGRRNPDGSPVHLSFYSTTTYMTAGGDAANVKAALGRALAAGHEIGNHTVMHVPAQNGHTLDVTGWNTEIMGANSDLVNVLREPAAQIIGFRTPYLEYNDNTFKVLHNLGFHYDVTIEGCWQDETINGDNCLWPYTLEIGRASCRERV